jgi:hypothetical protein
MRTCALLVLALTTVGCSKVKEQQAAADRAATNEAKERLRQIGLAMHQVESDSFPAGILTTNNRVGLSWRVQLLRFLDKQDLYNQFKLDEPWDSEHNKKLIDKMPEVYATPGVKTPRGYTHVRSFVAIGETHIAFIPNPEHRRDKRLRPAGGSAVGRRKSGINDGTSWTLMMAEAAEAVPWTKPGELEYDPAKPLPKLGVLPGGFLGVMCDGRVVLFPEDLPPDTLRALITINGDETIPPHIQDLIKGN